MGISQSIRPMLDNEVGQVCQDSPWSRLACPCSWGWLDGLEQGWQMLSQIVTATSAAGQPITKIFALNISKYLSHFYSGGVVWGGRLRSGHQTWAGRGKIHHHTIGGTRGLRHSSKFADKFVKNPFSTLAPVRWKAMKLDKEEAEEEMYMPTDKVFACRPIHVAVTHT